MIDNININEITNKDSAAMNEQAVPESKEDGFLDENYFQQIPNILINEVRTNKINPLDVVVYAAFANHVGNKEGCWPSNATIAKKVGKSVRTVQDSANRLEEAGHINRRRYSSKGTKLTCLTTKVENHKVIDGRRKIKQRIFPHVDRLPPIDVSRPGEYHSTPNPDAILLEESRFGQRPEEEIEY